MTITRSVALENKIWRQRDAKFLTIRDLTNDLLAARIIVVGETHGFSAHQDRQSFLIAALADRGRYPALVLEMLDPAGATKVAKYRRDNPEDASNLASALNWQASGWPAFSYYKPIFEAAFHAKLQIVGGDLPIDGQRRRDAFTQFGENSARIQSWRETMRRAHCGLIDNDELDKAARLQIARDESLIDAARALEGEGGAILIAGRAHARRDRNFPKGLSPETVGYVALMEANESTDPQSYLPTSINEAPVFDYIWFTQPKLEENACDRLRRKRLIK